MKKNLFIDLGTHLGDGISEFVKMFEMNETDWEVHTFEPSPLLHEMCVSGQAEKFNEALKRVSCIESHQKAAAAFDGTATLYFELPMHMMSQGSSIVTDVAKNNLRDFRGESTTVQTVDIVSFINSLLDGRVRENLIVKMDVEGAEFDILNQLLIRLEDGFSFNANKVEIYCEFHHRLFGGWDHQENKDPPDSEKYPSAETYIKNFAKHGIKILSWV